jgi:hypothetical protein
MPYVAHVKEGPSTAPDNDDVEWQGGRMYLHLGARWDDPSRH